MQEVFPKGSFPGRGFFQKVPGMDFFQQVPGRGFFQQFPSWEGLGVG